MALTKVTREEDATPFKFEKAGDTLKGYYTGTSEIEIDGRPVKKHTFVTTDGLKTVLGQADLYKQLSGNNCLNFYVEATFTGDAQKLKGGKTMKIYSVAVDKSDKYEGAQIQDSDGEDVDSDIFDAEPAADEVPPMRATPPKFATKAPSAESQAEVQALLGRARK